MSKVESASQKEPKFSRRSALGAVLVSTLAVLRNWWRGTPAQAGFPVIPEHVTPQTQAAIEYGLKWLVSQ
ncbi:unnamed protein product, partial [Scytosiphon promiscuus]